MILQLFSIPGEGVTLQQCKLGEICNAISFEYEKLFCGAGTFELEIPANSEYVDNIGVNTLIYSREDDMCFVVRNVKQTETSLKITGYDLNFILRDRLTMPPLDSTDDKDAVAGSTEACVKHFVDYNLISSPEAARNYARFALCEDKGRGLAEDSYYCGKESVEDVVRTLCEGAKLGYRVRLDIKQDLADKPLFLFDVAEQIDKTAGQSERNRVIFSAGLKNITKTEREFGVTAHKNVLWCEAGSIHDGFVCEQDDVVPAGWDRREEYVSLSVVDKDNPDDIVLYGRKEMADKFAQTDSLVIEAGNPLDFRAVYDVGDVVTAYDPEKKVQLDSVISAVTVKRSGSEYSVKLTLGESKPKLLDQYQKKNNSTQRTVKNEIPKLKKYISAKVANSQAITYDGIERGVLSVDFNVDGTDSDVVFAGNQLCDTAAEGTLKCTYKVDGAVQDFKPSQLLTAGKHTMPHFYPVPLDIGKHNFSVFINSPDGGKGTTGIAEFVGALSGQISGLKNNAPPNENLLLYFADVPAGTEIELPSSMYSFGSSARKLVDWGDGSPIEESGADEAVAHTYSDAGNYTVTVKCNDTVFNDSGYKVPLFSSNFSTYITRIYFPDNASKICWGRSTIDYSSPTRNFKNLETLVFGNSAIEINWDFKNSPKITSLLIPESVQYLYLNRLKNTSVSSFVVPKSVTDFRDNGAARFRENSSLTNLEIYAPISVGVWDCPNLRRLVVSKNTTVDIRDCPKLEDYEIV